MTTSPSRKRPRAASLRPPPPFSGDRQRRPTAAPNKASARDHSPPSASASPSPPLPRVCHSCRVRLHRASIRRPRLWIQPSRHGSMPLACGRRLLRPVPRGSNVRVPCHRLTGSAVVRVTRVAGVLPSWRRHGGLPAGHDAFQSTRACSSWIVVASPTAAATCRARTTSRMRPRCPPSCSSSSRAAASAPARTWSAPGDASTPASTPARLAAAGSLPASSGSVALLATAAAAPLRLSPVLRHADLRRPWCSPATLPPGGRSGGWWPLWSSPRQI